MNSAIAQDPADPAMQQAQHLFALAREARLLEFGLDLPAPAEPGAAPQALEHALELAMDADTDTEQHAARQALRQALHALEAAGLQVAAELSELDVDGVLGPAKLRVLSAVLARR